jgi:hypothetical protein
VRSTRVRQANPILSGEKNLHERDSDLTVVGERQVADFPRMARADTGISASLNKTSDVGFNAGLNL